MRVVCKRGWFLNTAAFPALPHPHLSVGSWCPHTPPPTLLALAHFSVQRLVLELQSHLCKSHKKIRHNLSFGLKTALPRWTNCLPRESLPSSDVWKAGRPCGVLLFWGLSGAFWPTLQMAALYNPPGGSRGPPHTLGCRRCG